MKKRFPWLWIGVSCTSFALANLKVDMFGTGVLDWAHWRFETTMFVLGLAGSIFGTCKAYYDQSGSKDEPPPKVQIEQPPNTPVPVSEAPASVTERLAKTAIAGAGIVALMFILK